MRNSVILSVFVTGLMGGLMGSASAFAYAPRIPVSRSTLECQMADSEYNVSTITFLFQENTIPGEFRYNEMDLQSIQLTLPSAVYYGNIVHHYGGLDTLTPTTDVAVAQGTLVNASNPSEVISDEVRLNETEAQRIDYTTADMVTTGTYIFDLNAGKALPTGQDLYQPPQMKLVKLSSQAIELSLDSYKEYSGLNKTPIHLDTLTGNCTLSTVPVVNPSN